MSKGVICTQENAVKKAAESVWAASKYWTMAVDQKIYLALRGYFRQEQLQLKRAFECLKETEAQFGNARVTDLPGLSNALFHVLGYFKKRMESEERQKVHTLIQNKPADALSVLHEWTKHYQVDYLMTSRLWRREIPFNQVPASLKIEGKTDPPYTWEWYGDHLRFSESEIKFEFD